MIPFQTQKDEQNSESSIQKIIRGALGKVIILDQAATTVNGLVPEGEVGFYGTTFYWTVGGNTYSILGTLV